MGALLALIPGKDWFYGALIVGGGILCWHFYDKYEDAVKYAATVKQESAATLAAANKTIADNTTAYTANLKQVMDNAAAQIAANNAAHVADLGSLRSLAAARNLDPVLQGAAGTAAEAAAWAKRLDGLESISANLAAALRNDDEETVKCWAERDELTGK